MHEGARRGFKWAVLIGLGRPSWSGLLFHGLHRLATFFTRGYVKAGMELFSFVFMLFLGMKFCWRNRCSRRRIERPRRQAEERLEEKLQPHSAL